MTELIEAVLQRLLGDSNFCAELRAGGGLRIELTDLKEKDRFWAIFLPGHDLLVRLNDSGRQIERSSPGIKTTSTILQAILGGTENLQVAHLRGEIAFQGEPELLQGLWRLNVPPA